MSKRLRWYMEEARRRSKREFLWAMVSIVFLWIAVVVLVKLLVLPEYRVNDAVIVAVIGTATVVLLYMIVDVSLMLHAVVMYLEELEAGGEDG